MRKYLGPLVLLSFVAFEGNANAVPIGLGNHGFYTSTLADNLTAQGHDVSVFNSYNAATLANLDVYIQDGNSFFDASLLDAFVFNGGTLIQLPWTFTHNNYTGNTTVMCDRISYSFGQANPGITVLNAASWLLDGVNLPAAGQHTIGREIGNVFDPDTNEILEWADGTALLGYREYGAGRIIGFNVHLITSDASPLNADWSNQIVYNAVNGLTATVPEPGSLALLGLGLAGVLFKKRKAVA